jgi:hypothetical protein
MNIYQRIVLILGALALLVLGFNIGNLFNTDSYHIEFTIRSASIFLADMLIIIGITLLLFFALKGIRRKKE